jgi:hypothetical protein
VALQSLVIYINLPGMVLYNACVFCVDSKKPILPFSWIV